MAGSPRALRSATVLAWTTSAARRTECRWRGSPRHRQLWPSGAPPTWPRAGKPALTSERRDQRAIGGATSRLRRDVECAAGGLAVEPRKQLDSTVRAYEFRHRTDEL